MTHPMYTPRPGSPVSQATCPHCALPTVSDPAIDYKPTEFTGKLCVCGHPEHRHAQGRKRDCWAIEDRCGCKSFEETT